MILDWRGEDSVSKWTKAFLLAVEPEDDTDGSRGMVLVLHQQVRAKTGPEWRVRRSGFFEQKSKDGEYNSPLREVESWPCYPFNVV
jgi:hypothetical protein